MASPFSREINEELQIYNNLQVVLYRIFMIHAHFYFPFWSDILWKTVEKNLECVTEAPA